MANPWASFTQAALLACEEPIEAWIREPANTYSNFIYFVVAYLLWRRSRRLPPSESHGHPLAFLSLIIGLASTIAHASVVQVFAILDFTAIFVLFSYVLTGNLADVYGWAKIHRHGTAVVLSLLSIPPQIWGSPRAGIPVFAIYLIAALASEWLALKKLELAKPDSRHLRTSLVCLALGLLCFILDERRIVCWPTDHVFQLHAVWHLLAGAAIYYIGLYFESRRTTSLPRAA